MFSIFFISIFAAFLVSVDSLFVDSIDSEENPIDNDLEKDKKAIFTWEDCLVPADKKIQLSLAMNIFRILNTPDNNLSAGKEIQAFFYLDKLKTDTNEEHLEILFPRPDLKDSTIDNIYNYIIDMKSEENKKAYSLGQWDEERNMSLEKNSNELSSDLSEWVEAYRDLEKYCERLEEDSAAFQEKLLEMEEKLDVEKKINKELSNDLKILENNMKLQQDINQINIGRFIEERERCKEAEGVNDYYRGIESSSLKSRDRSLLVFFLSKNLLPHENIEISRMLKNNCMSGYNEFLEKISDKKYQRINKIYGWKDKFLKWEKIL